MSLLTEMRMDKSVHTFGSLDDEDDERAFWHRATPAQRLEALEYMRQVAYGYDPATT